MEEQKTKFNKAEYNKAYIAANKEKYNKLSRDRNYERYYTDEEFRAKLIERAKMSVKSRRYASKNLPDNLSLWIIE